MVTSTFVTEGFFFSGLACFFFLFLCVSWGFPVSVFRILHLLYFLLFHVSLPSCLLLEPANLIRQIQLIQ